IAKGDRDLAATEIFPKTLDYYFKSLKIKEELKDKREIAFTINNIGAFYINQNKLIEADKFLHNALKLSLEIKALDVTKNAYENLSELYEKKGDSKKAFEYYKQYIAARDSINNEEKAKKQTRIEMNYEFEKKQAVEKAEHDKQLA